MNIVKIIIKDLEYQTNLVDKASAGFERIHSGFKRSFTVGKMLSSGTVCHKDVIREWKS